MKDIEGVNTYYAGKKEEVGPARLISNWDARINWKKCKVCGNSFPPPSVMEFLEKGKPLPKDFFEICENCK